MYSIAFSPVTPTPTHCGSAPITLVLPLNCVIIIVETQDELLHRIVYRTASFSEKEISVLFLYFFPRAPLTHL